MNKYNMIAQFSADRLWSRYSSRVVPFVMSSMCQKCKPVACGEPCRKAWDRIVQCNWEILAYYARWN